MTVLSPEGETTTPLFWTNQTIKQWLSQSRRDAYLVSMSYEHYPLLTQRWTFCFLDREFFLVFYLISWSQLILGKSRFVLFSECLGHFQNDGHAIQMNMWHVGSNLRIALFKHFCLMCLLPTACQSLLTTQTRSQDEHVVIGKFCVCVHACACVHACVRACVYLRREKRCRNSCSTKQIEPCQCSTVCTQLFRFW